MHNARGNRTISLVTHITPPSLPSTNSLGERSRTSSRSSAWPSRSLVTDVTARALTTTRLTRANSANGCGGGGQERGELVLGPGR